MGEKAIEKGEKKKYMFFSHPFPRDRVGNFFGGRNGGIFSPCFLVVFFSGFFLPNPKHLGDISFSGESRWGGGGGD